MKSLSFILVLLGILPVSASRDAGSPERYLTATLTVTQPRFDGREFQGLVTVCADEDGVFLDSRLSTETFDILDVVDCTTRRRIPFAPVEGSIDSGRSKLIPLLRDTCVGRRVHWRPFRLPDPSQSGCVELTLRTMVRSSDGKVMETPTTAVRVQP